MYLCASFPLILSIENHCTPPQQRQMAHGFTDVFGDMLLTEPVVSSTGCLPSPNQLKKKIIIKVIAAKHLGLKFRLDTLPCPVA